MERLAYMRIGTRLAVGFGFVLVLLTLMVLFVAAQMQQIGKTAQRIVEADYQHIALANQIDRGINAQANNLRSAVLAAADDEAAKAYLSAVSAATRELGKTKEALAALPATDRSRVLLAQLQETGDSYVRLRQKVVTLVQAHLPGLGLVLEQLRSHIAGGYLDCCHDAGTPQQRLKAEYRPAS